MSSHTILQISESQFPIYEQALTDNLSFNSLTKIYPSKGNLVYEYNPFRNYRLTSSKYQYKNTLYTLDQLKEEGITLNSSNNGWVGVPSNETDPILLEAGQLTDFETDELQFSLNNPVYIQPQYSYDGSVNLILNDGINSPRLINSRFSVTGKNTYEVVDRKGDNDTNIYDEGDQFNIDTSLYKRVINIPKLTFLGSSYGGNLLIGNYHFYFTFADSDGNETDFVAESSLVSIFIGDGTQGVRQGFKNENSHKCVKFYLSNIDSSYQYVKVYCTRVTSEIYQNSVTQAYKIDKDFIVNNASSCDIVITGFETFQDITLEELNVNYNLVDSAKTQAVSQNMLFLGNVHKPDIPYKELYDLSLRFLPYIAYKDYNLVIDKDYNVQSSSKGYYDINYIYDNVGYWNNEYYRLGIVYILPDNSLSGVFNIRGIENLDSDISIYSDIPVYYTDDSGNQSRNYIQVDELTNKIISDQASYQGNTNIISTSRNFENSKGVIKIKRQSQLNNPLQIYGIGISTSQDVLSELNKYVKGFFFVRQKRIQTTLCQAYTIGIDKENYLPIIPTKGGILNSMSGSTKPSNSNNIYYVTERFLNDEKELTHEVLDRYYVEEESKVRFDAAFCPDYDVAKEYYNNLFTGNDFSVFESDIQPQYQYLRSDDQINPNHFFQEMGDYKDNISRSDTIYQVKIVGLEDGQILAGIDSTKYSARAGEAEEAFRFKYIQQENKIQDATNIVRGMFGPYIAVSGFSQAGKLIDIKIPGYKSDDIQNYFDIRYNDKSTYYAISERIPLNNLSDYFYNNKLITPLFRGDCYICQFTHRVNRNFQDPSAPANHDFVDQYTWRDNYKLKSDTLDSESAANINLGDVNAVRLGMWVTFTLKSSRNLNIRAVDESNVDETAIMGHPRSFFPYTPMSTEGSYKIPEALCYNRGFETSVSERWNFEIPNVPYIKNWFGTRIMYSDIHINDAYKNGFRVFQGTHYRDYTREYGEIVKLVSLESNLLCVFEHGIALIPVNERAIAGEGQGGNIYINTSNVLPENPKIISDMFGSQWPESVLKVPGKTGDSAQYVYGVDTVAKKIWRTDGNSLTCISDFKVQEFLNNNITLGERELTPKIGIRNVKTVYNAFKRDVLFTFYDNTYGFEEKVWNLCWNELLQKFVTFYSWVPSYMENINNIPFSFNRDTSKWIAKLGTSHSNNSFADGITLSNVVLENQENDKGEVVTNFRVPVSYINKQGKWVTQTYTIADDESSRKKYIGVLSLSNRILPDSQIHYQISYSLERDQYGNYKKFSIEPLNCGDTEGGIYLPDDAMFAGSFMPLYCLKFKSGEEDYSPILYKDSDSFIQISDGYGDTFYTYQAVGSPEILLSELYYRNKAGNSYSDYDSNKIKVGDTLNGQTLRIKDLLNYPIFKDITGKRPTLPRDQMINADKIVTLLNIKATISIIDEDNSNKLSDAYYNLKAGFQSNTTLVDAGYYESVVAIIPKWNLQFLSTDFWKHGQAGLIDIADDIYPTYWYGKQHPFEFECIVVNDPSIHKIFTNLELVANKAKPESFHYEIIGETYDFAKDKVNMYFRQEAIKALWQYNGADISYNRNFLKVQPKQQPKSADFPHRYYTRQDTINEIEDYYIHVTYPEGHDYKHLSGAEIVYYPNRQEYRIWNHAMAVSLDDLSQDSSRSIIAANCQYLEDRWKITINPIIVCYKNEYQRKYSGALIQPQNSTWTNQNRPKLPVMNSPIPDSAYETIVKNDGTVEIPSELTNLGYTEADIDTSNWLNDVNIYKYNFGEAQNRKEMDVKDKFLKVRIRYSGEELVVIDFLNTIYRISYA